MAVKWGNGVLVNKIGYGYVRSDGKINAAWYINNWSSQQINDDSMMTPKTTNQWKEQPGPTSTHQDVHGHQIVTNIVDKI